MINFPLLKTGVVAQYPAQRLVEQSTWIGRFLDGTEQRCRLEASARHRWVVHLSLLTEAEVVAIREFVEDASGRFGAFSFTDPWDGSTYSNCSLDGDYSKIDWTFENNARTALVVRENRS